MFDCEPSWKSNPDIVADESYEEVYGDEPSEEYGIFNPWATYGD